MKKDEISKLLQQYLTARKEGREPYFDADELNRLLDDFEEKEDFKHYDGVLSLGLKLHPMNDEFKVRQCRFYLFKGEYAEALKAVENISTINRQDKDMIRLECYCGLKKFYKICDYVDDLIADSSCDYYDEIIEYIAPLLNDMEFKDEALNFIDYYLAFFPDNLVLKSELCYIYESEGKFEEAIEICNEMIDQDPYCYEYWFTLGRLHSMTSNYTKAIEAFDFAIACDDSDSELKILKAYCLFMNENYQQAIEAYKDMATDNESADRIKPLMAECYVKMEDFEQAYLLLKEIIVLKDNTLDATNYINFIRCCVETGREREASQMLVEATDLFPDNVRVLALLALSYLENGKEELALSVTDKIFKQLDKVSNKQTYDKDIFYLSLKKEFVEFLKSGKLINNPKVISRPEKHIPLAELTKEFLNNKKNSN